MDSLLDKTGRINSNVEVGKFTVLVMSTGTYKDGVDVPGAANAGPVVGVAQESLLPNSFADYSGGRYLIVSGTAWPAGAIPAVATGRGVAYRMVGISRVVAGAAFAAGARLNIADSQGRVKAIDETAGTLVNEVGWALEAAAAAGDVVRAFIMPTVRHS